MKTEPAVHTVAFTLTWIDGHDANGRRYWRLIVGAPKNAMEIGESTTPHDTVSRRDDLLTKRLGGVRMIDMTVCDVAYSLVGKSNAPAEAGARTARATKKPFVAHYNGHRPHRALHQKPPAGR